MITLLGCLSEKVVLLGAHEKVLKLDVSQLDKMSKMKRPHWTQKGKKNERRV